MSATNEFKITQIVDNGQMVQLTLIENITTEPISQQQMIMENVAKNLDSETKEQVMPLLRSNSTSTTKGEYQIISTNSDDNSNAKIKI